MLNARHEDVESGRFTQKFPIVAPGLIVYDRLLDAFCGRKKRDEEYRDPQTNDYYMNQEVFIPERYRDEVFSFIQNNVVTKEDGIGRKTTGEGLIARPTGICLKIRWKRRNRMRMWTIPAR